MTLKPHNAARWAGLLWGLMALLMLAATGRWSSAQGWALLVTSTLLFYGALRWLWRQGGEVSSAPAPAAAAPRGLEPRDTRSADELGKSEALQRILLDNLAVGVVIVDAETRVIERINLTAASLFGAPPNAIEGHRCHQFLCPAEEGRCPICDLKQVVDNSDRVMLRVDGSRVPILKSVKPIQIEGRRKLLESFFDITGRKEAEEERQRLEAQLHQSQKIEAIGHLAGGVAHDFNNLLTVILGYSQTLLARMPADDPHRAALVSIRDAGERAAALTRQLLAFSRKQILAPRIVNLNDVVANIEKMLRRLIGEDITLATVFAPAIRQVKVDPGQMEQVIINLALNARDAMPQGGRLTIETQARLLDEPYCRSHAGLKPGHYILLSLTDTGCGMAPEIKARIFEPFFTTKDQGKGTGLGLAMVFGIIKQSEGYVDVYSEAGVGSTFRIYLPAVEAATAPQAAEEDEEKSITPGGHETILLVEDEAEVRGIAKLTLETQGYRVLEAENGRKGLAVAESAGVPIDLLITDVVMPEMNGRLLAEALQADHPGLKVLFMSGYTDDAIIRHGILEAKSAFLNKPFLPHSLAKKVREVLDERSPAAAGVGTATV